MTKTFFDAEGQFNDEARILMADFGRALCATMLEYTTTRVEIEGMAPLTVIAVAFALGALFAGFPMPMRDSLKELFYRAFDQELADCLQIKKPN